MNRFETLYHEQEKDYTCGPASLLIAYKMLGIKYPEDQLTEEMNVTSRGADWDNIFVHAASRGFQVEFKANAEYKDLQKNSKKGVIIVGWSTDVNGRPEGHFSVLSDINDELIEFVDPGLSLDENPHILPKEEFLIKWRNEEPRQCYLLIYGTRKVKY